MFCPKCGTQCADDARFCKNCGSPIVVADMSTGVPGATTAVTATVGATQLGSAATVAMKPKRNSLPFVVAAVVAVVAIALVIVFVVKPFGSSISVDDEANNISLSYGNATGVDGWDYFYSSEAQGLCRAKTDSAVEEQCRSLRSLLIRDFSMRSLRSLRSK